MFYCDACAKRNGWPHESWLPRSRGPCECCGQTASCNDMPSSALPIPERQPPIQEGE